MKRCLLLGLFLALTLAAHSETVRLSGDNVLYTARGEDLVIEGSHGNFVISGRAGKVVVDGAHNNVVISEAAELVTEGHHLDISIERTSAVDLGGHNNSVVVGDGRPVVTRRGEHNDIVSTQGVVEGAGGSITTASRGEEIVTRTHTLTLDGSGVVQTVHAEGQDVILNGGANKLTLTGRANSVTINGAANQVTIEATQQITINGASNVVHYRSGDPEVTDVGYGNSVSGP